MRNLVIAWAIGMAVFAIAGCGGGVRVQMGRVPNTPEMGNLIGTNAARMGCQGRPRRGRFQIRCDGIAHPEQHLYIVVYDDASIECLASEGYEDDCQNVYNALMGIPQPVTAGGAVVVQSAPPAAGPAPAQPPPATTDPAQPAPAAEPVQQVGSTS